MDVIWQPRKEEVEKNNLTKFTRYLEEKYLQEFKSYQKLHEFSVQKSDIFWRELINYFNVKFEGELGPENIDSTFNSYGWFPNVKLNFAENLLTKGMDNSKAIHFFHESGGEAKVTYGQLRQSVQDVHHYLKSKLGHGDVLAAYMPNISETVVSMLAATSLGAAFTSTSCDFGVEGVVDRFGQSKPKVLVTVSSYQYNGKTISLVDRIKEIKKNVPSIEEVIVVDFLGANEEHEFTKWSDINKSDEAIEYKKSKFSDPLYIMYSSGTTGKPKCIVHSIGGTLLQHIKEHGLHGNMSAEKNVFFFTTCGWMMWNWLVSGLFFGGTITLYEGSPSYPSFGEYLNIINRGEINFFGTSPKFLKALEDSNAKIPERFPTLESVMSTGAPLMNEQFHFIHQKIKKVHIASICGGTDIIGCFMLGNPNLPVVAGEIQCLGLGMATDSVDGEGKTIIGQEGELVCRQTFPSRPIGFLDDSNNEKINKAYFNQLPGFWYHGDFITRTTNGGVIVHGRSDATLNPGGVRIGTAEIYRQTESINYLEDSICVGRPVDGDVEIVLFVKMKSGESLTDERVIEIKKVIRSKTTPRHVPRDIYEVSDIPYTRSGKKVELAVTRILQGKEITNVQAIINPDCLEDFKSKT